MDEGDATDENRWRKAKNRRGNRIVAGGGPGDSPGTEKRGKSLAPCLSESKQTKETKGKMESGASPNLIRSDRRGEGREEGKERGEGRPPQPRRRPPGVRRPEGIRDGAPRWNRDCAGRPSRLSAPRPSSQWQAAAADRSSRVAGAAAASPAPPDSPLTAKQLGASIFLIDFDSGSGRRLDEPPLLDQFLTSPRPLPSFLYSRQTSMPMTRKTRQDDDESLFSLFYYGKRMAVTCRIALTVYSISS